MYDYSFYSAILGLSSQWHIMNVTVADGSGDIEILIGSRKGNTFSCPACGAVKLSSGMNKARWQHENSLNIRLHVTALIPVLACECCGVIQAELPCEQAWTTCAADQDAEARILAAEYHGCFSDPLPG